MNREQKKALTRALKGASMSCLFAMLGEDTAVGEAELADFTGYSRRTVRKGLRTLENLEIEGQKLPLVQRAGRFQGWTLTSQGLQLALNLNPQNPALLFTANGTGIPRGEGQKLPIEGQILPDEGKKLPLAQRSSSSLIIESDESLKDKLLLHSSEGKKLPNEGKKLPLAEILVKQGCPRRTALPAIEAALRREEKPQHIEAQIDGWINYCRSEQGQSIKAPGIFTAAKIKNGEPAPEPPPEDNGEQIEWIT